MANSCYFIAMIKGEKEKVDILAERLSNHKIDCVGVFIQDRTCCIVKKNGLYVITGSGYCDQSVKSSMIDEKRNILDTMKELGLYFQCYSQESGCGFQEHYIIDKGDIIKEERVDWIIRHITDMSDKEIEQLCRRLGITKAYIRDHIDHYGYFEYGGFDVWRF